MKGDNLLASIASGLGDKLVVLDAVIIQFQTQGLEFGQNVVMRDSGFIVDLTCMALEVEFKARLIEVVVGGIQSCTSNQSFVNEIVLHHGLIICLQCLGLY